MQEGNETDKFWSLLGGKKIYADNPEFEQQDIKARLFQCSDATGTFRVSEIPNFCQDDLINDDVMVLDAYHEVFVWIGDKSTENEKQSSMKVAIEYVQKSDDGRSKDSPIYTIEAHHEPPIFTCYFQGWDPKLAKNNEEEKYQRKLRLLFGQQSEERLDKFIKGGVVVEKQSVSASEEQDKKKETVVEGTDDPNDFDLATLKTKPYPDGVKDPNKVEMYLKESQFKKLFGVSKKEFTAFPRWKQLRMKKESGLF